MVRDLLTQFLDAYLIQRDLRTTMAFLTDDAVVIGMGVSEVAVNKDEIRTKMLRVFERIPAAHRYEIVDYREKMYGSRLYEAYSGILIFAPDEKGREMSFWTRITMAVEKREDEWKIVSFHMSLPADQEENQGMSPLRYGRQSVGKLDPVSSRKLMEIMLSMLPGGIAGCYLEEGLPFYIVNDTMLDYLGYTYEEFVEATGECLQKIVAPEDWERVEKTIFEGLREKGEYDVRYRVIRKDGTRLWVDDKGHGIVTEDGRKATVSVMLDVSKNIRLQERLWQETMRDPLTGVFNRRGAISGIKKYLAEGYQGALMILDIDNFKHFNDTYGHQVGDQVLKTLAQVIRQCIREGDVAARFGGDEFLIFLPACTQREVLTDKARHICCDFRDACAKYDRGSTSVSIGIAVSDEEGDVDSLLKRADDRLYQVKKSGKGTFCYGDSDPVSADASVERGMEKLPAGKLR